MAPKDEEITSFIIDDGTFCNRDMPLDLRNVGTTYQKEMRTLFKDQIGKTIEVYVDNMLVKCK